MMFGYLQNAWQDEARFMNLLSYTFIVLSVFVVCILGYVSAPYGRYSRPGWGPLIPVRLAWFLQELPSLLMPLYILCFTECPRAGEWKNKVALGLFIFHYIQRTFIFPFLIRGGKPTSLAAFVSAVMFCVANGYLQGGYLLKFADFQNVCDAQFYAGLLLFLSGFAINIHSDHILRNLRRGSETEYKIPHGGMFEYVSGANFFGEILEWFGFAIMNNTLPAFAFFVFTLCNTGQRACHHHRWYQKKFEDYPKKRKALIPFLL
ncbi:3-oxo-5-alpha-steroid 4-dehydrogenase 1-like isoform X1 [Pomacea canaliculata]|uniref:3-oxo-5-alpha-steroid 4-dehydrogenase 1-like isoform X1 n=1 Tax=Pomacea canaliculata TaxID=400727 RepID=UPI000D73F806|nr:3-oxo-5-alpha-steroid 4-dehydrogenase 1-like isoform X1 [Pomacea canaliculata]